MNFSIFTGKIIYKSVPSPINGRDYIYITLLLPNNKKELDFYHVTALASDELARDILNLYRVGDSVIIESSIQVKKYKDELNGRVYRFILFRVYDIHPTHKILNNFVRAISKSSNC